MARTETVEFTNMCMICDGSRVVVIDRKKRDWPGITFPGGHIEPGESFTDAVIRVVQEETGLHTPRSRNWMRRSSEPWWSVSMCSRRRRCRVSERKSRLSSSIGTSSEQSNCPKNRKYRHSRISPNYADIFPRNKIP